METRDVNALMTQALAEKERDDLEQLGRSQTGCTTTAITTNGRTFTRDEILEILHRHADRPSRESRP